MGSATTGFNAPSREAIYRNVNMLTDDSFVYDYETFVAFDQNQCQMPMLHQVIFAIRISHICRDYHLLFC